MTLYQDALRKDAAALVAAARLNLGSPVPSVPSCPGWIVTDLVLHLGAVHRHAVKIVANHEREQVPISPDNLGWLELAGPYLHWLLAEHAPADVPLPLLPLDILTWFERGAKMVEDVVYGADPDEPIWTWSPDKRVAHYQRMLAIETAVHRWDVQRAYNSIDAALAHDGIGHTFDVMLPARRARGQPRSSNGESYHFHQTDGDGEWTVRFNPAGITVIREYNKSDITISGTASDLFLFLWGRPPARQLEVSGDIDLLDRYFELVPPR